MLILSYDISNDKLRTKFSKFIKKYGRKLQYSVYEIQNSDRYQRIILQEIDHQFGPQFEMSDSVMIIPVCQTCKSKTIRYGYNVNEEKSLIFV